MGVENLFKKDSSLEENPPSGPIMPEKPVSAVGAGKDWDIVLKLP